MGKLPVVLAFLQRMSDARVSPANCKTSVDPANGKCWMGAGWQAVGALGLAAVTDFNERIGDSVPQFASLAGCDKQLVPTVYDSASVAQQSVSSLISMLGTTSAPDALVGPGLSLGETCRIWRLGTRPDPARHATTPCVAAE